MLGVWGAGYAVLSMLEVLSGSQSEIKASCGALVTTELGNCVKVKVAVPNSCAVSVDIKQH